MLFSASFWKNMIKKIKKIPPVWISFYAQIFLVHCVSMRVSSSPHIRSKRFQSFYFLIYNSKVNLILFKSWCWVNPLLKSPVVSVWKNCSHPLCLLWSRFVKIVHIPYASCVRSMKIHPQLLNSFYLILHLILYFDDFKFITNIYNWFRDLQLSIVECNKLKESWWFWFICEFDFLSS